jgi:hypothetical protein
MPNSRSSPRTVFSRDVRVASQVVRRRCSDASICCSTDFTGTGTDLIVPRGLEQRLRIAAVGLVAAHVAMHVMRRQQAAPRGRSCWSSRAQWCALPHASSSTVAGGCCAKNGKNRVRGSAGAWHHAGNRGAAAEARR